MSPSRPSSNESNPVFAADGVLPSLVRFAADLKDGVAGIAFWTAIVLPFLHLPLLASGLQNSSVVAAFLVLLTLNVVAALIGHRHHD